MIDLMYQFSAWVRPSLPYMLYTMMALGVLCAVLASIDSDK